MIGLKMFSVHGILHNNSQIPKRLRGPNSNPLIMFSSAENIKIAYEVFDCIMHS